MSEYDDLYGQYWNQATKGVITGHELKQWKDSIRSNDTAALILFSTAGALAIGSVVLYFLEGAPAAESQARSPGQDLVSRH